MPQTLPLRSIWPSTSKPLGRTSPCGWPNQTAVDIWRVKPTYQVWNWRPEVPVLPPAGWPSMILPRPVAFGSSRSCWSTQAMVSAISFSTAWWHSAPEISIASPLRSMTSVMACGLQ